MTYTKINTSTEPEVLSIKRFVRLHLCGDILLKDASPGEVCCKGKSPDFDDVRTVAVVFSACVFVVVRIGVMSCVDGRCPGS